MANIINLFFATIANKLNNFNNFCEEIKALKAKPKGDMFEVLTKYVFLLHPTYCTNTKNIYLYSELTATLKTKLNLPTKDQGLDLILETKQNTYYGIQCKYRTDINAIVAWKELGTFMGMAHGVAKLKGAYYVTNTMHAHDNITNAQNTISILGDFFRELDNEFFENLKKCRTAKLVYASKMPLVHQAEATEKALEYYENNDRGKLIMACGSGKTYTSYLIDQILNNKYTLILVCSLVLLSQLFRDWVRETNAGKIKTKFILVGSDAYTNDDEYRDIIGVPTVTSLEEIKNELEDFKKGGYEKLVIISTYHSSDKIETVCNQKKIDLDLVIFDEAHKTAGEVDSMFSRFITTDKVNIKKWLFMTATPRIFTNVAEDDENIIDMESKEHYGEEFYNYSIRQAIQDKRLVDYVICAMRVENNYVGKFIAENKLVNFKKIYDAHHLLNAVMCYHGFTTEKCTHMLTYHGTVEKSQNFAKLLENLFEFLELDCKVYHMNGYMSSKSRDKILTSFKLDKLAVICSARVLNEGVNIPIVDSVCFVEPRSSTIDIVQCIGRALRLHGPNKIAKILIPYECDPNNLDSDNSKFGSMVRILKSLCEYDITVREYWSLSNEAKRNSKLVKMTVYNGKSMKTGTLLVGAKIDLNNWVESISLQVLKLVDSWESFFSELVMFVTENNRLPNKRSENKTEKRLGDFCNNQRFAYNHGNISKYRQEKLEKLIEGWYWAGIKSFNASFEDLYNFIFIHDELPCSTSTDEQEKKLSGFCEAQRQLHKKNKLLEERKIKLQQLKGWYWLKSSEDSFNASLEELEHFISTYGRIPSQNSIDAIEKRLGNFCNKQRILNKKGKLLNYRRIKLGALPHWYWNLDDTYNALLKKLEQFIRIYDKLPSAKSKDVSERILCNFCATQRSLNKKGKLLDSRKQKLSVLPHWIWEQDLDGSFNISLEEVEQFINTHNKLPSAKSKDPAEKILGTFCSTQRQNYKKGILTDDRITLLENLPLWYWTK